MAHQHDPSRTPIIKVAPGEFYVTGNEQTRIGTLLGSCVSACIRDPVAAVGGLNHFMLPHSVDGRWGGERDSLRYGNFAMDQLIEAILRRGGVQDRLEVKLFGGAWIRTDAVSVGARNARFAEDYLRARGLQPTATHMGGCCARRLIYAPILGQVLMLELPTPNDEAAPMPRALGPDKPHAATGYTRCPSGS